MLASTRVSQFTRSEAAQEKVSGVGEHCGSCRIRRLGKRVAGILALLIVKRVRPLFWLLVVAFNLVAMADVMLGYYNAVHFDLPAMAGQLGAPYAIPVIYMPALMIAHVAALYLLVRPQHKAAPVFASDSVASD